MFRKIVVVLTCIALLAGGVYLYARHRATTAVDEQLARLIAADVYDIAEYETFRLGIDGSLHLTNVHIANEDSEVVLQQVNITNLDYAHQTPWHIDVEINGMHFPRGLPDFTPIAGLPMSALLQQTGASDTLPVNVRYSYDYDADDSHRTTYRASTSLPQSFTLTLDGESRNLPIETVAALNSGAIASDQVQQTVQQLLAALEVPEARIALQDAGLVESWLAVTAADQGMTVPQMRERLQSQVRNYYLFLPQSAQGIAMQAGAEVAGFLGGGQTLSVAIQPEFGGSFARLQQEVLTAAFTGNFKQIADLLHLEVQSR